MLSRRSSLVVCFALLSALTGLCAQAATLDEYAVKAAYLFKLGSYVRWPTKEPAKVMTLAIWGEYPNEETLKPFASAKINGLPVSVVRIEKLEQAGLPQMLFVAGETEADRARLQAAVKKYRGQPVLILSDAPTSIEDGASVFLARVDETIKFELNVTAATSAGLSFDARLQKIAYKLHRPTTMAGTP